MAARKPKKKTKAKATPSKEAILRPWRMDLAAGLIFLSGMIVTLALVSQQPHAATASPHSDNVLGNFGASIGQSLLDTVGIASYLIPAAWFVLTLMLLLRQNWLRWSRRFCGWILLIPFVAALAEVYSDTFQQWFSQALPLTGSGGILGAGVILWLHETTGSTYTMAILTIGLSLSLMIALDVYVFRGGRILLQAAIALIVTVMQWLKAWWEDNGEAEVKQETPTVGFRKIDLPSKEEIEELPEDEQEELEEEILDDRIIPIHHHDKVSTGQSNNGKRWSLLSILKSSKGEPQQAPVELPEMKLLEDAEEFPHEEHDEVLRERATLLEKTYSDFGINIQVVGINTGPVITQYEVALEKGLRVHKVTQLADDVALNLRVPHVRMVAPIPGKSTVGIETPNEHRALVRLKEVMLTAGEKTEKYKLPLFLGKDSEGRPLIHDLAEMPHLLIAGRTGTGKSVCMNAIILSMLMTRRPEEVKMIMIDPKMLEMSEYGNIPHLMHPVVKDMKKAEAILAWAVDKMEERYDLLSRSRVRSIAEYNKLTYKEILKRAKPADEDEQQQIPEKMPYIVIFVDEMADLIMMMKKEVEGHIIRLAQKSRAAGIHLVVATQKPTVDVITGLIKSNLPARVCFKVVNKSDSRVVLDEMGADKLLGKGDMLFQPPNASSLIRGQCTYVDGDEIHRVVEQWEQVPTCYAEELLHLSTSSRKLDMLESMRERDELYESAIEVVIREQRGSVSLLQRTLGIGYGRAARLIDFMAEDGIVGSYNGSSAREVLHSPEAWEAIKSDSIAG